MNSNSSGCLEFDEGLISWKIYLQEGNVKYVSCSAQLLDQLKYYLHYLGWKQTVAALKNLPPSYTRIQSYVQSTSSYQNLYSKVIGWLLANKYLDPFHGAQLIEHITKDALQSCLWLDRGTSSWHDQEPIPLWIREQLDDISDLTVELSEFLKLEKTRLKQWQNCSPQLLSVHQRPYFTSGWEQKPMPISGSLSHQTLKDLAQVIKGSTSIRQLSLLLKKDELYTAKILSPYINNKIIYLRNAQPPLDKLPSIPRSQENTHNPPLITVYNNGKGENKNLENNQRKTWKIICIDDSTTILKEMQLILDKYRFEVTAVNDPVQAIGIIFRVKPDLILLDITMPKISGYQLCGLLRSSEDCTQTPIIMVTGNTGFIDKARAKLSGATDYLTKPFDQKKLIEIIEKYLG